MRANDQTEATIISRREAIRRAALLAGVALSPRWLAAVGRTQPAGAKSYLPAPQAAFVGADNRGTPTGLPITDIAFQTGWESLGTFGRTFRDVTGESPSEFRAREQAEPHEPGPVPGCWLNAARRPALTIAVSEKRRRVTGGTKGAPR